MTETSGIAQHNRQWGHSRAAVALLFLAVVGFAMNTSGVHNPLYGLVYELQGETLASVAAEAEATIEAEGAGLEDATVEAVEAARVPAADAEAVVAPPRAVRVQEPTCSGTVGQGKACQVAWDILRHNSGIDAANHWCTSADNGCEFYPAQSIQCQPDYGNYSVVLPVCTLTPTLPLPPPPTTTTSIAGSESASAVAIIVVGQLRTITAPAVLNGAHLLTRPFVRDVGAQDVHLYLCVDQQMQLNHSDFLYGGLNPFAVFAHSASSMEQRLKLCHDSILKFAGEPRWKGKLWPRYRWIVRTRPDLIFYAEPPAPTGWPSDSIYLRARMVGLLTVEEERLSHWDSEVCARFCVWRASTGKKLPPAFNFSHPASVKQDELHGCAMVDDQFAIFHPKWFTSYFVGGGSPAATPAVQPCVQGHGEPIHTVWPEERLTCRLLDAGARLQIIPLSFRIYNGSKSIRFPKAPPFTKPSALPSAGPIQCKNGGR